MKKIPELKLRINRRVVRPTHKARLVEMSAFAPDQPTPATRTADKLVLACRENMRFLNRHLRQFEKYMELPPDINNVLYLAYTVKIKEIAPFSALQFRRWMEKAGIETKSEFSFVNHLVNVNRNITSNNPSLKSLQDDKSMSDFCLPCHQYLGIIDLEHIVNSIGAFITHYIESGKNESAGD
jgi:dTDP-4-amino-4,6-dideoxygalactose transaminase